MSDGTEVEHVDQSAAGDSYESMYQIEDSTDDSGSIDGEEGAPSKQPTHTPTEGNEKTEVVDDPAASKTATPLSELKEIPKGFSGLFYSKTEDDEFVKYNRDKAVGFLTPKKSPFKHEYQARRTFVESKEPVAPVDPAEERRLAAEKHFSYEKNVRSNMTMWPETYKQYINAGHNHETATHYANEAVNKVIADDLKQKEYDRFSTMEERIESKFAEKYDTQQSLEAKKIEASTNRSSLISYIAEEFGLEKGEAGNQYTALMTEYAGGLINEWFDAMNPDSMEGLTQAEYNDKLNNWWRDTVESNSSRLNLVFNFALNAFNAKMLPHNLEMAAHNNTQLQNQNNRGNVRAPSSVNRNVAPPQNSEMANTLKYYGKGGADDYT